MPQLAEMGEPEEHGQSLLNSVNKRNYYIGTYFSSRLLNLIIPLFLDKLNYVGAVGRHCPDLESIDIRYSKYFRRCMMS